MERAEGSPHGSPITYFYWENSWRQGSGLAKEEEMEAWKEYYSEVLAYFNGEFLAPRLRVGEIERERGIERAWGALTGPQSLTLTGKIPGAKAAGWRKRRR